MIKTLYFSSSMQPVHTPHEEVRQSSNHGNATKQVVKNVPRFHIKCLLLFCPIWNTLEILR